jgi:hypothetical protein
MADGYHDFGDQDAAVVRRDYRRDGVVCLRDVIGAGERARIAEGIEADRAEPGPFFRDQTPDGSPARYQFSYWMWPDNPAIAEVALRGSAPGLVAALLEAERLHLLMDNWFLREAGALNGAPWHHDEPYFDFEGGQMAAVWIALEDVSAAEGLTFIAGSHRDQPLFQPKNFKLDQPFDDVGPDYAVMPDFDAPAFEARRRCWDMAVGDCLIFDLRTVHAATAGQRPLDRTIRRLSLRYGDEGVRFRPRGPWTRETSDYLIAQGQVPNAPLECPMLPVVWPPVR